jgi:hypothetical protein
LSGVARGWSAPTTGSSAPTAGERASAARALRALLLAVLLAAATLGLGAAPAGAASDQGDRAFSRYEVDVVLAQDGTAQVTPGTVRC